MIGLQIKREQMNREQFLIELKDILEREEECRLTDELDSYEEWDSLSKMAVMAFFDKKIGVRILPEDLKHINTVEELFELSDGKIL